MGSSEIAENAVTTSEIATNGVDTLQLAASAVETAKINDLAVTTAKIANLNVTAAKIGGNAVTSAKIAANAVSASEISANAVSVSELASGALSGQTMSGNITFSGNVTVNGTATLGNATSDIAVVAGNLGIQDTNPPQFIHMDEVGGFHAGTGTSASVSEFTLDSFAHATFRVAKYIVSVKNTTDSDYQAIEILMFHDGTNVYLTQYASIFDNGAQAEFDADISGTDVRLRVTPASGDSMTYKYIRQTIEV